jgi:hypothetical protein
MFMFNKTYLDISHLSEEQQKLINNNEGWGKRAISQNTKWEISESSQHDTRPRLPTQATGTELWDPVKVNQSLLKMILRTGNRAHP